MLLLLRTQLTSTLKGECFSFQGRRSPFFIWRMPLIKVNFNNIKEDLRKIAIALMIAGLAGFIIESVSLFKSAIITFVGLIFWILGLVEKATQEGE